MKERPILMSAPMVRAILAGTKTQTRRAMKPQPSMFVNALDMRMFSRHGAMQSWNDEAYAEAFCPYGIVGDRLWVKESHRLGYRYRNVWCTYKADGFRTAVPAPSIKPYDANKQRPSIHMPRWASRITLEITGVRVERLQEISEEDAIAEGIHRCNDGLWSGGAWKHLREPNRYADPCNAYCDLWASINGPGSWDANPWVWCLTFKRTTREGGS